MRPILRAPLLALVLAFAFAGVASLPAARPSSVAAASCVRVIGGVFNAPGNDNYSYNLNGEYIILRNYCATYRSMTGHRVHDYGRKHTYFFPTGYRIYPGYSVKLHSGGGTNGKYHLYWKRTYGAVWNNTAPERAYLRNSAGTLLSSWSPY